MVGFADAIFAAARGGLCDLADFSGRLTPPEWISQYDLLEPARTAVRNAIASQFCNKPPIPEPPVIPGGQCEGDSYQVLYTRIIRRWGVSADEISDGIEGILGKVTGANTVIIGGGPGYDKVSLQITSSSEPPHNTASVNVYRTFAGTLPSSVKYIINEIRNVSNPGRDCGNLPTNRDPYQPGDFTFNVNIDYTDNAGDNYTIPIVGVIGLAYIDADLNLNVPVNIKLNPTANFNFNNKFNFDVNLNINTGGAKFAPPYPNGSPPPRPTAPPNSNPYNFNPSAPLPSFPPDVPEPPGDKPDQPKPRVIRAVVVTVTDLEPGINVGTLYQDDNPDIAIPNYGYVSFFGITGSVGGAWTADIPVKNKRTLIPCEWLGGAYKVAGTPRLGVSWTLTPIYAETDYTL